MRCLVCHFLFDTASISLQLENAHYGHLLSKPTLANPCNKTVQKLTPQKTSYFKKIISNPFNKRNKKKNRKTKLVAPPIIKPTQDALNFTKKEPNLKRTREKKKRERFSNHKHKIKEKEERKEREGERVSPQKKEK